MSELKWAWSVDVHVCVCTFCERNLTAEPREQFDEYEKWLGHFDHKGDTNWCWYMQLYRRKELDRGHLRLIHCDGVEDLM